MLNEESKLEPKLYDSLFVGKKCIYLLFIYYLYMCLLYIHYTYTHIHTKEKLG